MSSTWCELQAVRRVFEPLLGKLLNERVRRFTRSQNVSRILMVGSRKPNLQKEVLAIHPGKLGSRIFEDPPNAIFLALRLSFEPQS